MWVFSNSLSDIFDKEVPIEWLSEAFDIMEATPGNIYLLLTKRGPNIVKRWLEVIRYRRKRDNVAGLEPSDGQLSATCPLPRNVALGITVVTQEEANRDVPHLLRAKWMLKPLFVFLSMEPLMGPVNLTEIHGTGWARTQRWDCLRGAGNPSLTGMHGLAPDIRVDWVITGGESGVHARPSYPAWFQSLRDQCAAAGVAFHFKQWGEWQPDCPPGFDGRTVMLDAPREGWDGCMWRVGKKHDPGTLDGVLHDARPLLEAA